MKNPILRKLTLVFLTSIIFITYANAQGIYVDFNTIPQTGTVLVYSHQDDDLIWMLPWWNITDKFIEGAMPPTPMFYNTIHDQQSYLDNNGYNIDYESNWITPWAPITDLEYIEYYWNNAPGYEYLALDHLEERLADDETPLSRTELNKMKAKLEQFIASPDVSRIITHDNWGEYGHEHHKGVNKAVRELAVKYRKDVWMLGTEGDFQPWPIPDGSTINYTLCSYDGSLFDEIRNIYIYNDVWTWDYGFIPSGPYPYYKVVNGGNDQSTELTGEGVTTPGAYQAVPGSYIFDGLDDYMTLMDQGNTSTTFTIAMRVMPDVIRSMDISKMTEYPSASTCDRSFYMGSDGRVTARIFDGSSRTVTSSTALSAGSWTHILMTGNGSSLKIYINGSLEGTVPAGSATTSYDSPEFVLGQAQETSSFFEGQIYDVRLFDYVLSDSEIAALAGGTGTTYTITASAGTGGSITPSGSVLVTEGMNKTFSIQPNSGYEITDVLVDGGSVGAVSSYTFMGVDADHSISASFTAIATIDLTISGLTASDKVYDRTTTATLNTGSAVLVGVEPGDDVYLISAGASGTFDNRNVGTNKLVTTDGFTLGGADAYRYTLTQPLTTADITPKGLTITGITANDKEYNRNTTATLSGSATLVGVISPDVITLGGSPAATFSNYNVGTNKPVSVSGYTISGMSSGNYTLSQPTGLTADITARPLDITGLTADDKEYDRSTAATLSGSASLVGVISPDVVTLGGSPVATFSNYNAGTNKPVSVTGYTISGTSSGNYTLTGPTGLTADITRKPVSITGVTANDKEYDRSTVATLSGTATLTGVIPPDAVTAGGTPTGTFSTYNAGTNKPVTVTGYTLSGSSSGNYILTQPMGLTADITPKALSITGITVNNKEYDRSTAATLSGSATLAGVISPDAVTLGGSPTATFASYNAGNGISVSVTGYTITGSSSGNYTLTQPTGLTANITVKLLTITGLTADDKEYDRSTAATLSGSATLVGVISPDVVTLGGSPVATFSNYNAGTNKTVSVSGYTITGSSSGNYGLIQPSGLTADITPKALTLSGINANDKEYDRSTVATLSGTGVLTGVIPPDAVTVGGTPTGTFNTYNAGTNKPVTVTGYTLTGSSSGNYTLTQPTGLTADITPKGLTITGITINDKEYDRSTAATLSGTATLAGIISPDVVTVGGSPVATFSNYNAGTNKPVSVTGYTITGTSSGNYTLSQPTGLTADITARPLSITGVTVNDKEYDRNTTATLSGTGTLTGVISPDVVTLGGSPVAFFTSYTAGTNKAVTVSGYTLSGSSSGNYTVSQPTGLTADITPKPISMTGITANDKVYDGTTTATLSGTATLTGVISPDAVTAGGTPVATFSSNTVGTNKAVSVIGYTLSGTSSGNYTLSQPTGLTADITPKALSITGLTANNKVYDGNTTASLNTGSSVLSGVIGGDQVILVTTGATGSFSDATVGTGKTVTTIGFSLSGTASGNYTLTQPTVTASITSRVLTIGGFFAVSDKVYDGTTSATITSNSLTLVNKVSGDDVILTSSAVFSDKMVGSGKVVSLSGTTLTGSDAMNYSLSLSGSPTTTGNITSRILTIGGTFTVSNKVYDGTTGANISTNSLILLTKAGGDDVTLSAVAVFSNKLVGSGKTVTLTGSYLSGTDADNYTLSMTGSPTTTGTITARVLTIGGTFTAGNKVYDGSTTATISTNSLSLLTKVTGDNVTLSAVAVFSNKQVGTGKPVTLTGSALTGSDAGNYSLSLTGSPTATANITVRVLTLGGGFTVNDKEYDGNTSATITSNNLALINVLGSDIVTLVPVATFSDAGVGTNKTVSLSGSTLTGTDSPNYTLSLAGAPTTTADIIEFGLTVTGVTAGNKVYDATTTATVNSGSAVLVGVIPGDNVSLVSTGATGTFSSKNAGTGKTVVISGLTLGGTDAGKYTLIQPTTTANITPGTLTITGAIANNKIYDGTTSATLNTGGAVLAGIIGSDIVSLNSTGATGVFSDKNAGTGKQVSTTGFTLGGVDAPNYTITSPTLTASITVASLTVDGVTAGNKIYDGTTSATLNTGGATLSGVYGGDLVSLNTSGATGSFSDKNAGTGKTVITSGFTLGGSGSGNYALLQPTLTANITTRSLTITVDDLSKGYGTVLTFSGTEITTTGLVSGDTPPVVTLASAGSVAGADAGSYAITASGGSDMNYSYSYVAGVLTVTKAPLNASADDLSRYYGSPNPVLTITYTGFRNNDDASMLDLLPAASTGALVTSDVGVYPITLSGGSDNNYSMTLEDGNLDVLKAPLTIRADNKNRLYGEDNPELTITYSGFVLGQDQSILIVLPTVETSADINSLAGNYEIDVYGAEAVNYSFIYQSGLLTISKGAQSITFETIPDGLRMTQEYKLEAMATSGLTVTFETSDPNKGTIEGNILTITGDGTFTVTAKQAGDDTWNAAEDVSQTIVTLPTFDNISSLFTPNGDGINDYWYIPDLEEYGAVEVTVYNRFGKSVYHSDSYMNDWDGTFNGYQLPSATYYYIIKSSTKGFIKGAVNIVR